MALNPQTMTPGSAVAQTIHISDMAYCAGLFDGEGCVAAYRLNYDPPRWSVRVTISMVNPKALRKIQNLFGGSLSYSNPKNCWSWYPGARASTTFLRAVLPYLTVKKDEAILALQLRTRMEEYKHVSRGCDGQALLSPAEVNIRQSLVDEIKALKRRQVA